MKILFLIICALHTLNVMSQNTKKSKPALAHTSGQAAKNYNTLYQYGTAESFVGGLFEATLPLKALKQHGDFGIGAPGFLDGELVIYQGHAYQTQASGKTTEVPDSFNTALAFVTHFKADTIFHISGAQQQNEALAQLEQYVNQKNAAYAIKISGKFSYLKTRAFPPYTQKPYPPLATLLDRQKFFDIRNTNGVIIGYKLPPYLNGLSVEGYHFHFLSDQKDQGGHVLDFIGSDFTVEIAKIKTFILSIPQDEDFMNYNFKTNIHNDLEKVEKGH
jgi:acetolactate decarboxylase